MGKISDENKIDILLTYQDAIAIVEDKDEEKIVFSESVPKFMSHAAKKANKLDPESDTIFGTARARQIAQGGKIPMETVRRIKYFAQHSLNGVTRDMTMDSPLAKSMVTWGIPPSLSGAHRVIKWADAQLEAANAGS